MRQQADQIVLLVHGAAFLEQAHERGEAGHHLLFPLFFPAGADVRIVHVRGNVRPAGKVAAALVGIVEKGRQHHRGQLDRDSIDPIERLTDWQTVKQALCPRADQ